MRKNNKQRYIFFNVGQLFKFKLSHKTWTLGAGFGYSSSRHCLLEVDTGMKYLKKTIKLSVYRNIHHIFKKNYKNIHHQFKKC